MMSCCVHKYNPLAFVCNRQTDVLKLLLKCGADLYAMNNVRYGYDILANMYVHTIILLLTIPLR